MSIQEKFKSIDELDRAIAEAHELIAGFEKLVTTMKEPSLEELDESIRQYAFTPSKSLLFVKNTLLDLIRQKENTMEKMNKNEKLAYEL